MGDNRSLVTLPGAEMLMLSIAWEGALALAQLSNLEGARERIHHFLGRLVAGR